MDINQKMFTVIEKKETNSEERSIVAWGSRPVLDRDQELILGGEKSWDLDNFQKNPVLLLSHDYSKPPVGRIMWVKATNDGLRFKAQFAKTQAGEELWELYKSGIMHCFSVGFLAKEWETPEEYKANQPKRIYKRVELLEISCVSVPSCPAAVVEEVLGKQMVKEKDVTDALEQIKAQLKDSQDAQEEISPDGTTEKETEVDQEEKEVDFCSCESAEYEDDICKGCGGKRKPKKEIDEDLIDIGDVFSTEVETTTETEKSFSSIPIFKFTMPEDKEDEQKERWNKSLSKSFDIANVPSRPSTREFELLCQFLGCQVKNVFQNDFVVPMTMLGSYLAGFKDACKEYTIKDTRRIGYGEEYPPIYEVVKLNSKIEDDFLINGTQYYDAGGTPLVVKISPSWWGTVIQLFTSLKNRGFNKSVLSSALKWVEDNNPMKNEKFALTGEFLTPDPNDDFDSVILSDLNDKCVRRAVRLINDKGVDLGSRGMMLVGAPGCGKTKSGRIILSQTKHTFIWVSSKDFMDIGPIRGLELAFSLARSLAPTVLFMEDIDTWLYGQGVNDLLKTELDGLRKAKGVITVLTSNFPEQLQDALLDRPGRFHDVLEFELPDKKTRMKMLEDWTGIKSNFDEPDHFLYGVVDQTEGYSGAHIRELVDFAKMIAEEEDLDIGKALIESLEKLAGQRKLIQRIRENKKKEVDPGETIVKVMSGVNHADLNDIPHPTDESNQIDLSDILSAEKSQDDLIENLGEILVKSGRVLSDKNRRLIQDCVMALNDLLTSTEKPKEEMEEEEKGLIEVDIEKLSDAIVESVSKAVSDVKNVDVDSIIEEAILRMQGKMF